MQMGKEQNGVYSTHRILIVDDDDSVRQSLSGVLELEGYKTADAATADHALDLLKNQYFDVILIDIKLADTNGLHLLQRLQKMTPETIKIVITGYPSMRNIIDALDLGANGYIMKPITPQELLRTIRSKIEARARFEDTTKKRLAELTDKQVTNAEPNNFHKFLQEMVEELATFGLTTNQAKVYVTLVSVGLASASEIAKTAGIRREEVYRITCELEEIGIITRKIDKPHKFSAFPPEDATLLLIKSKLSKAAQEIDVLDAKRNTIASNLKKFELLPTKIATSIDTIPATENLSIRLIRMAKRAKKNIDAILSYNSVLQIYWAQENYRSDQRKNCTEETQIPAPAKVRIITESRAYADQSSIIKQLSLLGCNVSVKYIDHVPFSAFIIDDTEALWGRFDLKDDNNHNLWANDQVQITILKTAFESLWNDVHALLSNSV
jgi:DNA-binding response OmpR family regulator